MGKKLFWRVLPVRVWKERMKKDEAESMERESFFTLALQYG